MYLLVTIVIVVEAFVVFASVVASSVESEQNIFENIVGIIN